MNVSAEFEIRRFRLPDREIIIAIEVWGGVRTPILAKGGRRRSGMVPFERALVSSYSNFSSIFTRVRDIAAFVLQHATFSSPHR